MIQILHAEAAMTAEMARIERESFSHPWTADSIRATIGTTGAFGLCVFAEDGQMTACAVGTVLLGEGEILHIATHPLFRGRGYGEILLRSLLTEMQNNGAETVFLEVREGNLPARRLYEKCGFILNGIRKRYYRDPVEDAVLMTKHLQTDELNNH